MISISIITINLNNAKGLKKTFDSIFCQNFKNFEYIVIDGGSTDGSLNLIQNNIQNINFWISEKDNGIYSAMNKGIKQASGTYVQFLNAGDTYLDNNSLRDFFEAEPSADIVYADYTDADTGELYRMPEQLSFRFFYRKSLNHQATLIKKSLFYEFEFYNEESPIIADWEFFILTIILHGARTQYIPKAFIRFDFSDSMSNKAENQDLIKQRRTLFLQQYFPLVIRDMEYIDDVEQSTTFQLLRFITKMKSIFLK
jgi:glycosyltransferase involved in cell wall biosynthesis